MTTAVNQEYWNSGYKNLRLTNDLSNVEFKDLFDKYLSPNGSCFEVGCYPGTYLTYLCKRFGYIANGIDATPFTLTRLRNFLEDCDVTIGNLYQEDFLNFQIKQTFDVVCSFGFIEHFYNFEEVITKHIQLVNRAGILIMSCPNFRGIQRILHSLFDQDNLKRHVLEAMNLDKWRNILEQNGMTVLHQGYYRTADFWVDSPNQSYIAKIMTKHIHRIALQIDSHLYYPNALLSPHMVSISKRA